jgi:hypothetical protein
MMINNQMTNLCRHINVSVSIRWQAPSQARTIDVIFMMRDRAAALSIASKAEDEIRSRSPIFPTANQRTNLS